MKKTYLYHHENFTNSQECRIYCNCYVYVSGDDEPEEEKGKTVEKKVCEFMQGVSEETRSNTIC
jgi:hypothetical protein